MRLPLSTSIKTRTGAPEGKDARIKNAYVEVRGDQSVVRKRPIAQGGVVVGSGIAQGGIDIDGVPYWTWGDNTPSPYTGGGTTWDSGTSYSVGDHVSKNFVDYWALTDNTNQDPTTNPDDWSDSFVPDVPATTVYATWNPADKGAVDLSGGNLIATVSTGTESGVRSTISKSSGKWYWEGTISSYNNTQILSIGIATSSADLSSIIGIDLYGWAYADGNIAGVNPCKLHNDFPSQPSYGNVLAINDVIGIALDMDSGALSFYHNGASLGVAFTGITGNIFAATSSSNFSGSDNVMTYNFGQSAFAYSIPSGYNPGLYT